MAWELSDFGCEKEVELSTFREWVKRKRGLYIDEIETILKRTGRLKWDFLLIALELEKVNLSIVHPTVLIDLFKTAVTYQMPMHLLLRLFHPLPKCRLPRSRFTPLHLIVNSTYPVVEKRVFICKMISKSRLLLMVKDACGRTPISYCKDKRLKGQMMAVVAKAVLLWVKLRSVSLTRLPLSVVRLIATEYI